MVRSRTRQTGLIVPCIWGWGLLAWLLHRFVSGLEACRTCVRQWGMSEIPAVLTPALGSVVGDARQLGDDALIEALREAEERVRAPRRSGRR